MQMTKCEKKTPGKRHSGPTLRNFSGCTISAGNTFRIGTGGIYRRHKKSDKYCTVTKR